MGHYFDNAATSHPKPEAVYRAVQRALVEIGANPGRGAHRAARDAAALVHHTRRQAALLLGTVYTDRLIFTKNATEGLNLALKGRLRAHDLVAISPLEHNAVVRPLERLKRDRDVQVEVIGHDPGGVIDPAALERLLERAPRLVVINHASNVSGALQPLPELARICRRHAVPILVDAAQTAGLQPLEIDGWDLAMVACAGHKGLLGPPGTGLLFLRPDLDLQPLLEGGTGSRSEQFLQPLLAPDRYESGTPNLPGIAGLGAGIDFILATGRDRILTHELRLAERLASGLEEIPAVQVIQPPVRGTGAVSFRVEGMNPGDLGRLLDEGFDIAVRTGLHCAPLAHRALGTLPEGTVRVSPGFFSTDEAIDELLRAVRMLIGKRRRGRSQ
ncbi:MAG: hypothetical protein AUK55_02790 [Syntrophobacteraceae bacterium CG2_30_61_12]|nr:MAG: hypothetical protein AUK55_02790 [Syntrophobacteraceae bacterium CG2_30_61_12]